MRKRIVVCVCETHRELHAFLRPEPRDAYAIEYFATIEKARSWLETAAASRVDVVGALVEHPSDELPVACRRLPERGKCSRETLQPIVNDLATQFELEELRDRTQRLEALSDVGVALAGSFDIQAILRKTREAAKRLTGGRAVEVLYTGCEAIHSRALWSPDQPAPATLTRNERRTTLKRVTQASFAPPEGLDDAGRAFFPITYQNELLGCLVISPGDAIGAESVRLISILTLQTATALRNIHLTQERIHFERLSAVGRMIGTVAHDFRSPLTALRGYAGMLTQLDLNERERRAYGRYVVDECDRLNHMVDELLEFTRGGQSELTPEWLAPASYLGGLAARLRERFGERGVKVRLELARTDDIFADKQRLDRALWNVAVNACQAMPDGGELVIRTSRVESTLCLSIEDDGTGIPEEVRHRIFEPFFSYGKSEGIGLGMLIARNVMDDHDGDITVDSKEGVGTQVRFYLPAQRPEPSTMATINARASAG